mmetsp:Transcript_10859/g.28886  ORF Transcript_10859/g.28886 Transcript_10859/m.28886 type:complete len:304 (-) Transcript_10859:328-1239(-)
MTCSTSCTASELVEPPSCVGLRNIRPASMSSCIASTSTHFAPAAEGPTIRSTPGLPGVAEAAAGRLACALPAALKAAATSAAVAAASAASTPPPAAFEKSPPPAATGLQAASGRKPPTGMSNRGTFGWGEVKFKSSCTAPATRFSASRRFRTCCLSSCCLNSSCRPSSLASITLAAPAPAAAAPACVAASNAAAARLDHDDDDDDEEPPSTAASATALRSLSRSRRPPPLCFGCEATARSRSVTGSPVKSASGSAPPRTSTAEGPRFPPGIDAVPSEGRARSNESKIASSGCIGETVWPIASR